MYLEVAANLNDIDAMNDLAMFYEKGLGGPKDMVSGCSFLFEA